MNYFDITLNEIRMEAIYFFRYFEEDINGYCCMRSEIKPRVSEREKVGDVLRKIWKGDGI